MKLVAVLSNHTGCGITTILVNLAYGLTKQGCRILIMDLARDEKLPKWLKTYADDQKTNNQALDRHGNAIFHSRLGIDFISGDIDSLGEVASSQLQEYSVYDYIFANSIYLFDNPLFSQRVDYVMVCTDLNHGDELEELQGLEEHLSAWSGKSDLIKLLIPNKINTKEWEHNSQYLFSMADRYGFEKIADPIPHCERIHDLPLQGHTVWDLKQKNLQEAFNRLVETVQQI